MASHNFTLHLQLVFRASLTGVPILEQSEKWGKVSF